MSDAPTVAPMSEFDTGLVACDECGAPNTVRRLEPEPGTTATCLECGNQSFSELDDPSGL